MPGSDTGLERSLVGWLLCLRFDPEDEGSISLRNVIILQPDYIGSRQCNKINRIWSFHNMNPRYMLNTERALYILPRDGSR
jgi:hypothetical protein